jgi:hypothetical protein
MLCNGAFAISGLAYETIREVCYHRSNHSHLTYMNNTILLCVRLSSKILGLHLIEWNSPRYFPWLGGGFRRFEAIHARAAILHTSCAHHQREHMLKLTTLSLIQ